MITVTITSCQEVPSFDNDYKNFLIAATIYRDNHPIQAITVVVSPWCGEYDYEDELLITDEEEETIQIAIGQYFEDHNISVGRVGR